MSDPSGTVYAVASRVWAEANLKAPYDKIPDFAKPAAFHVGVVQNGRILLLLPNESASYANSLENWAKARDRETLILIKLSGRVVDLQAEYQVVVPPQGRSRALRCGT